MNTFEIFRMSKLAVGDLLWDGYCLGMIVKMSNVDKDLAAPDGLLYYVSWYTTRGEESIDYGDSHMLWRWKSAALKLANKYGNISR